MGKNVFITGAAGFIGFHLARQLALRGDHVVGYDNVNDYYPPQLKRMRIQKLREEGITVIEGDICDVTRLNETIKSHRTTHLVHLAAQAGVRYSLENPQAYVKSNLDGFVNILEVCRLNPSIKLTYASSSSVYGRNTKVPFAESDRTDMQASLYGVTKKTNELMASSYHHLYKIPVTGLRFFTVYGPWGRPDMAYYTFTKAILSGEPIPVYNHGHMERDFTYIDDIVRGTIAAIDLEAPCEVFNLGNHRPVKLLDFIAVIEKSLGIKAILKPMEMQAGDVVATYADISHSFDKLGFTPQVTLEEGIPLFVNWYKSYQSAAHDQSAAAKTQQKI